MNETGEVVRSVVEEFATTYTIENHGVWVSGQNANAKTRAQRIRAELQRRRVLCGVIYDSDGGCFLEIRALQK